MYMHKEYFSIFRDIFNDMFQRNYVIHGYNTRQSREYYVPKWRLEITRRSNKVQGVHLWNAICDKIDINVTYVAFKYNARKYLFDNIIESL